MLYLMQLFWNKYNIWCRAIDHENFYLLYLPIKNTFRHNNQMQCMDLVWIPTEWTKCKMTFWDKEILKEIVYPCYLGNILNCGRCDGDIVMKLKKKQGILVKWYGTSFKISKQISARVCSFFSSSIFSYISLPPFINQHGKM